MTLLLATKQVPERVLDDVSNKIRFLVQQNKRFGVLVFRDEFSEDQHIVLEACRKRLREQTGQYIFLDPRDFEGAALPEIVLTALETFHVDHPFRINLPFILKHNPGTPSPFINRAIIWQKLCDRLLEDEVSGRPTLLALSNFDLAPRCQHDFGRLIRLHQTHHIRRTFLLAISQNDYDSLDPELCEMIDLCVDI